MNLAEDKYRLLFESSRDALMTLAPPSWRFTSANRAALELFAVPDEARFTALGPWDLSPERQPDGMSSGEKARQMIATAMREGSYFFEWTHRKLGGGDFPCTVLLTRTTIGGHEALQATVRDISAQKRAEEAIEESEKRYRSLFDDAQDGMALADAETGRLVDCNQAICRMVERGKSELLGQMQTVLHPPDGNARDLSPSFRQHQEPGEAGLAVEDCLLSKSGRMIPVEIRAARIRIKGRDCLLGIFRDQTEHRRIEEQLRRSQKLEAVGQLAGGVAHEFNNLLMGIGGYAQLLLGRFGADVEVARDLSRIRELSARGAGLSRQLLTFSRQSGSEPVTLDINSAIEKAHEMLQRLLPENITLERQLGRGLWMAHADPGQLEQVLVNLVINARDAMPDGGRLLIETANVELDAAYAQAHPDVRSGRHVMLSVADTGVGMDEATKRRLFEPFFTTKEVGKGTGLGLATIHGIVKQHGGHIDVYSEPGQGSTFKVFLPRVDAAERPAKEAGAATTAALATPVAPNSLASILLVEDEAQVREVVQRFLEGMGYRVVSAPGPAEAEEAFRQHGRGVDLLITDISMPGMSGAELHRRLSAGRSRLRAIFMSAHPETMIRQNYELEAGSPFIQKPFVLVELASRVRQELAAAGSESERAP
jgi:two-component system cell cycle sensor histidine kinase/response regulator CckA